jgi:protease-4
MNLPLIPKKRIAVVDFHGAIGSSIRTQVYVPLLKRLREDKRTRAVVLDIDSPGGSATVSDYLYLELQKLAQEKPLVAFVRGTCASGSYFLACAASRIISQRSAIVGSIGVLMIRPDLHEMLSKIGVNVDMTTTGPYKGMGMPFRPVTPEEGRKNQEMADRFFDHFVAVVAEGRHVSAETARGWATGEVWWAREAMDLGLIDELGDLERATAYAAERAGIAEHVETVRPPRPVVQRLMSQTAYTWTRAASNEIERLLTLRSQ